MSLFGSLPLPSKQLPHQEQSATPLIAPATPIITALDTPVQTITTTNDNSQPQHSSDHNEQTNLIVEASTNNIMESSTTTKSKMSSFSLVPSSVKSKQTPRMNPFKSSLESGGVKKIGTIIDGDSETSTKRKFNSLNNVKESDEYDPLIPNKYEAYLLVKKLKKNEEKITLDVTEDDEIILSTPVQPSRATPVSSKSSTKSTISFNLQKKTPNSSVTEK